MPPKNRMAVVATQPSRRQVVANHASKQGVVALAATSGGEGFLKAAFGRTDFRDIRCSGVPDKHSGRTIAITHETTFQLTNSPPFATTIYPYVYILQIPTPGVAFYWCGTATPISTITTTVNFFPYFYPSALAMFPVADVSSNVSAFRYIASGLEITNTANLFSVQGGLTFARFPVSAMIDSAQTGSISNSLKVTFVGLDGINGVDIRPDFSSNVVDGAMAVAVNTQPDWEFTPVMPLGVAGGSTVTQFIPARLSNFTFYLNQLLTTSAATNGFYLGLGNTDALCFALSGLDGSGQSFSVRSWATIEYQVPQTSIYWELTTASPPHDPLALETYEKLASLMPPAVKRAENANFWTRLIAALKTGLMGVSRFAGSAAGQLAWRGAQLLGEAVLLA